MVTITLDAPVDPRGASCTIDLGNGWKLAPGGGACCTTIGEQMFVQFSLLNPAGQCKASLFYTISSCGWSSPQTFYYEDVNNNGSCEYVSRFTRYFLNVNVTMYLNSCGGESRGWQTYYKGCVKGTYYCGSDCFAQPVSVVIPDEEYYPQPNIQATSIVIDKPSAQPNESITSTATVQNLGNASGSKEIVFSYDDIELARRNVTLDAGQSTQISVSFAAPVQGSYLVCAD